MAVESKLLEQRMNETVGNNKSSKANNQFKVIRDQEYIDHFFQSLARTKKVSVLVHHEGQQTQGTFNFSHKTGTEPVLTLSEAEIVFDQNTPVTITFFFRECLYRFETKITGCSEKGYLIAKPSQIFTSFKRFFSRYKFSKDEAAYLSIPGQPDLGRLIDLSINGLSFHSKQVYPERQKLRNLVVKIPDKFEIVVSGEIAHVRSCKEGFIYGLVFSGIEWLVQQQLFSYIFERNYPDIKPIKEFSITDLSDLYQQSKYLSLKSTGQEDERIFMDFIHKLEKLKQQPLISSSFVHYKNGKLLSIGTVTRIYERTFLQPHLINAPETKLNPKAKTDIYISLADFLLNHPHFENFIMYLTKDLDWHQDLFSKMNEIINDQEKLTIDNLARYECNISEIDTQDMTGDYRLELMNDKAEFVKYCQSALKPLEVSCYEYEKDDLDLKQLALLYRTEGLFNERKIWRVVSSNKTVAYVVAEVYDDTLDLDGVLDTCRIYMIKNNKITKQILAVSLLEVSGFYRQYRKEVFNLLLTQKCDSNIETELPGLRFHSEIKRVLMSREGMAEYHRLLLMDFEYYSKYFPLTYPQKGIWYLEKMYPGTSIGNIAGTVRFKGEIDYQLLEKAINIVIEKNDGLRLRIIEEDGEPKQYISEYNYQKFDFLDLSGSKDLTELYQWDQAQTQKPFKLIDSNLYYFTLLKINDQDGGFYIKTHHLISDAWTMSLIVNQINEYYSKLINQDLIPNEKKPSYIDFVLNEEEYYYSEQFKKNHKFWSKKFETIPEFIYLKDKNVEFLNPKANRKTILIEKEMALRIKQFCENNKTTVYTLFLSILAVLIHRITLKADLAIGALILNRLNAKEKDTVGMFINPIPVRLKINNKLDFATFLQEITKEWMTLLRYQKYPYELMVKEFREKHNVTSTLYDITLSYQNAKFNTGEKLQEFSDTRWHPYENQTESLNIHINDREDRGEYIINFDYLVTLFSEEEIDQLGRHILNLLNNVIKNPTIELSKIEILSESEKRKLLFEFNNNQAEYPKEKTIHQLFEEQVVKSPNDIAVVYEKQQLTYSELNKKSNQLARLLRNKGSKPDSIIGLMVERSVEMVIGIFGILKAGSAFLPIDPEYPEERIKDMVEDSGIKILLTQHSLMSLVKNIKYENEIIYLDDPNIFSGDNSNLTNINKSDNLLYLIYTSGSTGKPKGVLLEHRNLVNLIMYQYQKTNIDFTCKVMQFTTISFDVCYQEIFSVLLEGGTLYIASDRIRKNIISLFEFILNNQINILFLPTSFLKFIFQNEEYINLFPKTVKHIITAGEQLIITEALKKLLKQNQTYLHNHYGPSETHVVTALTIDPTGDIPDIPSIGTPINNTQIYILNENLMLQPIGTIGELYISGDNVGRGYLNRPELTNEKFLDNPFIKGKVMYRTGDLARWQSDGKLEFLGRTDHQVKIRGFRVELGEVERHLLNYNSIREAVAITREDVNGVKYLCAYIVANQKIDGAELKRFLAKKLPEYMIPTYIMQIDKMPLTPNKKINRLALPEPEFNSDLETGSLPEGEIEKRLAVIWQEILGIEKVGSDISFFDLGGDSLKAITLSYKIHKEFEVEIPVKEIFEHKTIKGLAKKIQNSKGKVYLPIERVEESEYYPVSSAQKRMFLISQHEDVGISYNMPLFIVIEGPLCRTRFEKAFKEIIKRHESLRTFFEIKNGEVVQRIKKDLDFQVDYVEHKLKNLDALIRKFVRPFNLGEAPLIRVKLVKLDEYKFMLMLDMHHIISDGISIVILLQEFAALYRGETLPEIKIQYKDFAIWQNQLLNDDIMKKQLMFWANVFSDMNSPLNMPLDYNRGEKRTFKGEVVKFTIPYEQSEKLKRIALKERITLNGILISLYFILLYKYTDQEDITIGTIVTGRNHPDLENIIGMFNNFVPIRHKINSNVTFLEHLDLCNKVILNCLENQDFPYDRIIEELNLRADVSRNPLFDTMLVFHNQFESWVTDLNLDLRIKDLSFRRYEVTTNTSKLDFKLDIFQSDNGELNCFFEYNINLFKKEKIKKMADHFINIINEVIENPLKRIAEIDILSATEKRQILLDFNNTKAKFPENKTIVELFEEQVEKTPNNIAVIFGQNQLTYQELNCKANNLAEILRKKGVKADSVVSILVNRSLEMAIGIMGILKAGGAYLPIDPKYPEDRVKFLIEDSGSNILLTQKHLAPKFKIKGLTILEIDNLEKLYPETGTNLKKINNPNSLAYIIYTSGSTGVPKGVMIEHRSVVNRIIWMQKQYPINEEDVILQKTPYTFDVSVWELLWWSIQGARVCFLEPDGEKDPEKIIAAIEKNRVSVIHFVPSMLNIFLDYLEENQEQIEKLASLRYVFASGEALNVNQVERFNNLLFKKFRTRLNNLYGPTEATVDVSYYNCSIDDQKLDSIPIGKPIDNIELYVVNKNYQLQPIGIPGELCIAGVGLARGYLNRPELTNEKFVPNPFKLETKMYRTGDLAMWQPDGNIRFLGRMDFQVKIRGFRIELGEIESQLLKHEAVNEAVVVAEDSCNGNKCLIAYLVCTRDLITQELREFLKQKLPDYMIPSQFIRVEKMPLSSNGKIDRRALVNMGEKLLTGKKQIAPRNDVEEKLAQAWIETLGIKEVSIDDNFFEIGGDSLSVMKLLTKTHLYNWGLSLQDFYKYKTIRELSEKIIGVKQKETPVTINEEEIVNLEQKYWSSEDNFVNREECYYENILLTGATGFLGAHLLRDLIETTQANIMCLVRGNNIKAGEDRLLKNLNFYFGDKYDDLINKRIFIINGDITLSRFGLAESEYEKLGQKIDLIIHSAALVKYYGEYSESERINVFGTKEVLDFASMFDIKLGYVSTIAITGLYTVEQKHENIRFSEKDFFVGQRYVDNIYVRSKFEAENLVNKAINEGLDAKIFRVGILTGRYCDGHFQVNIDENAFYRVLKSIINLGRIPEETLNHELELTPVDFCSKAIVELLKIKETYGRVFHLYNPHLIKIGDIINMIRKLGFNIKALPNNVFDEHIKQLIKEGKNQTELMGLLTDFDYKRMFHSRYLVNIDSEITDKQLELLNFKWPEIEQAYITKIVQYMINVGYLHVTKLTQ